jgi:hypothetical protein
LDVRVTSLESSELTQQNLEQMRRVDPESLALIYEVP